jgi:hypothetical protein
MATTFSIRPLQGRARWVGSLPGALPPATLRIPFGDYHRVFTSRRRTGLRLPKGYGRSGRTARYGPRAGEGSLVERDWTSKFGLLGHLQGTSEAQRGSKPDWLQQQVESVHRADHKKVCI